MNIPIEWIDKSYEDSLLKREIIDMYKDITLKKIGCQRGLRCCAGHVRGSSGRTPRAATVPGEVTLMSRFFAD